MIAQNREPMALPAGTRRLRKASSMSKAQPAGGGDCRDRACSLQNPSAFHDLLLLSSRIKLTIKTPLLGLLSSRQQLFHAALRTLAPSFLQLLPAHGAPSSLYLRHGDAVRHRANQRAEVAADAFIFHSHRHVPESASIPHAPPP